MVGFSLYYGDSALLDPDESVYCSSGTCTPSTVGAGELRFTLPPTHPMLGKIETLQKTTEIVLFDGDDEVFRGRAMATSEAFDGSQTYVCESNLAYFNDVQLRPYSTGDDGMPKTPSAYFNWLVASYNDRVDARYKIHVGINEADRIKKTIDRESSYMVSVRDEMREKLVDVIGGRLRMRYDHSMWFVDYLADGGRECAQTVEFGENLTDYMRESSAYKRYTAVVPYSRKDGESAGSHEHVFISDLPDGDVFDGVRKEGDRLVDVEAAAKYGIVECGLETDAELPENLQASGIDFLRTNAMGDTLDIKAVDRHLVDAGIDSIREGDYVRVISDPHGIDGYYPCLERKIDFVDVGQSSYTLGTPTVTLTSVQAARIATLNAGINKTYDKATGASQEAKDAAVKADDAKLAADAAQTDAGVASEAASEAQKRADAAKTAAESAASEATDAKAAAADADAKATLAQTSATEAKSAADTANEAAGVSGAAANAAQEAAGAAQATADAASTQAGQVAAETAAVERELAGVKQDALDLGTDLNGKIDSVTSTMTADYAKKTELSTTEATLKSEITKSAAEIQQTVSETYAKTTDVEGNIATAKADLQTQITQNAGLISSTATAVESAQADATAAQTKANSASTAAEAAQSTANTAKTNAATAQSTADTAKTNAATAQSAANKAQSDATAAATAASAASTAAERAKADAIAAAGAYADSVAETLQGQIDGAIETWSGTVAPTASNAPAKDWTTADARAKHVGDLYYDTATGYAYRYSTTYTWTLIKDTDVTKAIADAAAAQSAADAAKASASTAQSTANTAKTNAATAQTAANNAQGTANTAKTNAANAQASADAAQAAADGAQADVDALGTRVTTAETAITQSAEQIALKANKTDVYAKGDTYSKTQADAAIKVSADNITSTVSETYATQTSLAATDTKAANAASAASTSQSTADTAKANAATAQTGVNGLTTRMTAAESSITQQADSIALRATKTEVATAKSDAVSAAATDATTKANNAKSAAVSAAASDATTKANNALANAKTYSDAQLKVQADRITSNVSATDALGTRMSTVEQTASGFSVELSKVSSAKYLSSGSVQPLSTVKTRTTDGYDAGEWSVVSTSGVRVGDTAFIRLNVSDLNVYVYAVVSVTSVTSATALRGISHGYVDQSGIDASIAASTAQSTANTANSTANTARTEAANAAETATNYMEYTSAGLDVGNKISGVWSGLRSRMAAGEFQVLNAAGTVLSSFGADLVEIGKNSASAVIRFCAGKLNMGYNSANGGYSYVSAPGSITVHSKNGGAVSLGIEKNGIMTDWGVGVNSSGIARVVGAEVQLDGKLVVNGYDVPRLFVGTKIMTVAGSDSARLWTQAEFAAQFGRQFDPARDFVGVMNADGDSNSAHVQSTTYVSGDLWMVLDRMVGGTTTTRVNYLVAMAQ